MIRFARPNLILSLCLLALAVTGQVQAQSIPPKPGPKSSLYTTSYRAMETPSWKTSFPNLTRYEVLAPFTAPAGKKGAYNCIAHTLRIYTRWVWPGKKVADFDRIYGEQGYRRIKKLDYRFNPGLDKIVLYAKIDKAGQMECTHGARQLADGTWTSKLGAGPLIRHTTPEAVAGPSYGRPIAVYVKARRPQPTLPKPVALASAAKVGR